ncbi:MAG TPA: MoxR family ATPase [Paludibacteraceae bacterium]|jgi:MoxR-like ATPase|nr:MoxR family ATPase [Paludibacteraceae bacterium]HPH63246.1 MoxR family ATPase [Paludibacteraceae bacterium]
MEEYNDNFSSHLYVDKIQEMREKISSVIAGQEKVADLILTAILADGHVLIEGVPGVAKTLTARLISKLINAVFSRMQFTSDLMPSDVLGTNVFNMSTNTFEFHKGPAFGDIILVDEINRAPAKTQSALFEIMEERQTTIDGKCYSMGDVYTIVATQNPIEQEGTYRLPEAQLDRFLFKINMGYPKLEDEIKVLRAHDQTKNFTKLNEIQPILTKEELLDLREKAHKIFIDEKMITYIAQLIQETRQNKSIYLGASPRASIALMETSKAFALIQGRNFVIPDDIKMLIDSVLCHRILLTAEAEMEGITIENVIDSIVEKVEVPK